MYRGELHLHMKLHNDSVVLLLTLCPNLEFLHPSGSALSLETFIKTDSTHKVILCHNSNCYFSKKAALQYLHLLLVLGQHADVLLLLVVFLLHDGPLTLVQGYVLP